MIAELACRRSGTTPRSAHDHDHQISGQTGAPAGTQDPGIRSTTSAARGSQSMRPYRQHRVVFATASDELGIHNSNVASDPVSEADLERQAPRGRPTSAPKLRLRITARLCRPRKGIATVTRTKPLWRCYGVIDLKRTCLGFWFDTLLLRQPRKVNLYVDDT